MRLVTSMRGGRESVNRWLSGSTILPPYAALRVYGAALMPNVHPLAMRLCRIYTPLLPVRCGSMAWNLARKHSPLRVAPGSVAIAKPHSGPCSHRGQPPPGSACRPVCPVSRGHEPAGPWPGSHDRVRRERARRSMAVLPADSWGCLLSQYGPFRRLQRLVSRCRKGRFVT